MKELLVSAMDTMGKMWRYEQDNFVSDCCGAGFEICIDGIADYKCKKCGHGCNLKHSYKEQKTK